MTTEKAERSSEQNRFKKKRGSRELLRTVILKIFKNTFLHSKRR